MSASLSGRRIIVTRPAGKADHLIALLEERGAVPIHMPMITIEDPISWDAVDNSWVRLAADEYDWIVFTSVNAVEKFLSRAGSQPDLGGAKVAAVGSATEEALKTNDINVDVVPEEFIGDAVAGAIGPGGGRVLLPRVAEGPRGIVESFSQRGWVVDEVVSYRNVPVGEANPLPDRFDAVLFASGSAARNFADLFLSDADPFAGRDSSTKLVVCIGPKTAVVAAQSGLPTDLVADPHTDDDMVLALEENWSGTPAGD